MPYLKVKDGTELYFNDYGSGMPVVLIHGWPLSSASWEYQTTTLAENGFRVITYDRRGFGKSSQPFTGYNYDTLADDLAALLEALDLKGAALVGFSMGGGEVARYLGRYGSKRVAKAVFISAVTPFLLKTADNPEGVDQKVFTGMIDGIKKDRADFMKGFLASFFGRSMVHHTVSDAMLEFNWSLAMQASLKATLDCAHAFADTDFRDDCTGIRIPTLIVHGKDDQTVPIDASARRTATMIPGATLLEYDGEAHGLNVTAPDKLNADLIDFLRS
jgi:non-heme chloroperoxidase